ncbi:MULTISPECIES: MFS transporter [Bacillus]|uniref:MFS family permease n=1 Tax=Bacillus capparidis TaxID=1840411 RepID=A0ABS4CSV3_9BACI|nr:MULTISPECIES: MFS transporter [Bacillus]MBP1080173.1 MFS family permease [Bacillus capparidis]MED1094047.1 MFS transporter [Bacillus capparidis]
MSERNNNKVISIVAIVTALSLLGDSMLYIILPLYWEHAGLDSIWQVGILLSINRFIRLPINPLVGWIYKKISLRTGLTIALTIGAITTLGYGFFNGFIAWVILRGIWGIAWSFFRMGGLTSVAYYAEKGHRGKAMGTYNGLSRLGSLFGMILGGIFVPIVGLDIVASIFGVLTLVGIPIILKTLKQDYTDQRFTDSDTSKHFTKPSYMKYKVILISISGFFITLLIQGVFTSTLSSVIENHYGIHVSFFDLVLSAALLSGVIQAVRWIWEPFLSRSVGMYSDGPSGRVPLYILSLTYSGLLFGFISFDFPLFFWIIVILLVMAGATAISTLTDAIALDTASKSNVVSFLTIYSIIQDVGAALGPFISYMVIELNHGYTYLYWGGTAVLILIAFVWTGFYFYENSYLVKPYRAKNTSKSD